MVTVTEFFVGSQWTPFSSDSYHHHDIAYILSKPFYLAEANLTEPIIIDEVGLKSSELILVYGLHTQVKSKFFLDHDSVDEDEDQEGPASSGGRLWRPAG